MDGPVSAPYSPPEMPVPTKWNPLSAISFSRRIVSRVERIAAVHDDVAPLEVGQQFGDGRVSCSAGLDHQDDRAGMLD